MDFSVFPGDIASAGYGGIHFTNLWMMDLTIRLEVGAMNSFSPIAWNKVDVFGGLLHRKQRINADVSLPIQYKRFEERGSLEALKLNWKPGDPNQPHPFWDSDFGKWIEAAAYSLAIYPDPELEAKVDEVIEWIAAAQLEDGYFNTYYTLVDPENRWTNLYYMHELYCAGHLTEGAVAYYQATGKSKLLDVMRRYLDHIDAGIGKEEGKIHGYPGHQEIELALVKLYRLTKEEKYLKLSQYFIDERGREPYFFEQESLQRGVDLEQTANQKRHLKHYLCCHGPFAEYQAHRPVREQDAPVGHAVRAMYMYSAMADLAGVTGDRELREASNRLWDRLTQKQLYITGGIGPSSDGERFTFDYDLPNEITYNETCASVGLIFWAHRMLQLEGDGKYADILEQTLYNTALGGVSAEGDRFSYANYLSVYPDRFKYSSAALIDKMLPGRQEWFNVACCPPNVARLIASIGQYMYSTAEDGIYVHLYNDSETSFELDGQQIALKQQTGYPWYGNVKITVQPEQPASFQIRLRKPGWCEHTEVRVNGEKVDAGLHKGYLQLQRIWRRGDEIELTMEMSVRRIEAHPSVRSNSGRVALQRGPVVYCLEEIDNGKDLNDVSLPDRAKINSIFEPDLFGGCVVLEATGLRRETQVWGDQLYRSAKSEKVETTLRAIPYFLWANRGVGEMVVWVKSE